MRRLRPAPSRARRRCRRRPRCGPRPRRWSESPAASSPAFASGSEGSGSAPWTRAPTRVVVTAQVEQRTAEVGSLPSALAAGSALTPLGLGLGGHGSLGLGLRGGVVVTTEVEQRTPTGGRGLRRLRLGFGLRLGPDASGFFGSSEESSPPRSNSEPAAEAFAAGPTSSVSVTVSSVWVVSPASGSALVASSVESSLDRRGRRAAAATGEPALASLEAAAARLAAGFDSPLIEASSICATSRTSTSSRASPLLWAAVSPSESITRQNGQPTAIWSAPVRDGFLRAGLVDPGADGLLHPHAGAAGAAAEGPLGVARHLDEPGVGEHVEQLARSLVDLVVPAEVARVVVGDRPSVRAVPGALRGADRGQLLLAHEPVEQLGVVHDLELDAELAVLVLQGVEAVRAGGDDLLDLVLLEGLDVLLRQALEHELVAGAAGGVAGAGLAVAEHGEARRRPCRAARRPRGWSSWRGPRRRRRSRPRTATRPRRGTRRPRRRP